MFEEHCPYYLAMGMSYSDYWDGDASMTRYYRKAHDAKRREKNFFAWLQGLYVYHAVLDASPALNPFGNGEVFPYRDEPIPLEYDEKVEQEERKNQSKMENGLSYFTALAGKLNQKFKEGDESGSNGAERTSV